MQYSTALMDSTNIKHHYQTPKFPSNSQHSTYQDARDILVEAELKGSRINVELYDHLEELKHHNEQRVQEIESLMIKLDQTIRERNVLNDQLLSKNNLVRSFESEIKAETSKLHTKNQIHDELSNIRTDNNEGQENLQWLKQEIEKLQKLSNTRENEIVELNIRIKDIMANRDSKDDALKRIEVEIIQVTDQLEEVQHMVQSLKRKNTGREIEINRMSQEADDNMKKYTALKNKVIKQKEK